MSMKETEKHGVWTYNEDPEYMGGNAGLPDMIIVHGLNEKHATLVAQALAERYPADTWEVRDYKSDVVTTLGTPRPDLVEARELRMADRRKTYRRPLGKRGV